MEIIGPGRERARGSPSHRPAKRRRLLPPALLPLGDPGALSGGQHPERKQRAFLVGSSLLPVPRRTSDISTALRVVDFETYSARQRLFDGLLPLSLLL